MTNKNAPFTNHDDHDPWNPDIEHHARGLLVPNGGKLITKRIVSVTGQPPNQTVHYQDTTNAGVLIQGLSWIELRKIDGKTYSYGLFILGKAPTGVWDLWLNFEDESGDNYTKRVYSHTENVHSIDYNSSKPNITKITWKY